MHVTDLEREAAPSERVLRTFYHLTPAEARVAALMARGASSTAMAEALGYAPSSAAWYAKRILAKTEAPTRAAFAAMVFAIELEHA